MIIGISGKKNSGKDLIGTIILQLTKNTKSFERKKFADKLKDIVCLLIGCTREQLENEEFKNTELGEEWWKWEINNLGDKDYFSTEQEAIIYNDEIYKGTGSISCIKPTPRFLLQNIGTDLFRNQLHPDIWVNSLMKDYKPLHKQKLNKKSGKIMGDYLCTYKTCNNKFSTDNKRSFMCNNCVNKQEDIYPNWVITDLRFPNELKAIKDKDGISIRVNRITENLLIDNEQHHSETALDNAKFDYVLENDGTIEELVEKVEEILLKEKVIPEGDQELSILYYNDTDGVENPCYLLYFDSTGIYVIDAEQFILINLDITSFNGIENRLYSLELIMEKMTINDKEH